MNNVNEYVIFTNSRGASIRLELVSIEGLGDVEADIQTQGAPFQDGTTYIDTVLEPRYINAEFIVRGASYDDVRAGRTALASVLNSKLGLGVLSYHSGETVRKIDAVAESVPYYPDKENRGKRWQRGMVTFVAPNPYWKSLDITEEPAFESLFEWPSIPYWEEGEDGDLYFEMGMQRAERIIFNDGDAPAPLRVDFYGPADSPIIENLTIGEFIRINKRLEEGEVFRIDTKEKTLFYIDEEGNETNVLHWIDLESTFFDLVVGENEITCHCAISNNQKDFDIYYNKLYSAV